MVGLFIEWLYSDAPQRFFVFLKELTLAVYNYFSISLLASTLINPWRHDTVDLQRLPIRMWGQAIINNVVSRFIGLTLRLSVIFAGMVALGIIMIGSLLFMLAWYGLPLLLIASMVYGATLMIGGISG